jgi:hypothetical protein
MQFPDDNQDQNQPNGTPVDVPPVTHPPSVPPIDTNHRYYNESGQANPIMPEQKQPPTEKASAPQEEPSSPDYKLWKTLHEGDLYDKGYDDFKKQFNNDWSVEKLWSSLKDSDLYDKNSEDFKSQFFQHLPTKPVQDANQFIGDYINSPKATKAINKITGDQRANEYYQQQQAAGNIKDNTNVNVPIRQQLLRIPALQAVDHDNFVDQATANPDMYRQVLDVAKKQNPQDAADIDASMYVADASRRPHSEAVVKYYADQIKDGTLEYDIKNQQLVRPVTGVSALFNGMKQHDDAMNSYEYLTSHNDDDIIKYLNSQEANDPDKPVMKGKGGLSSFLESTGSNLAPLTKMTGPAAALGALPIVGEGAVVAGAVGAALGAGAGAEDFHHTAYANTLMESYRKYTSRGIPDEQALQKAKEDANVAGLLAAGQGIALSAIPLATKELEYGKVSKLSSNNLNAFRDVGENVAKFISHTGKEVATQASMAGTLKTINNVQQGKETMGAVLDDAQAWAMFTAGLSMLKIPGALKGNDQIARKLGPGGRESLIDGYAKMPEPLIDAGLHKNVLAGNFTVEQAADLKREILSHAKENNGKPDLMAPVLSSADDFIHKYENGVLDHIPNNTPNAAMLKVAKENGIEAEEGKKLSVKEIYDGLKKKQEEGKVKTFVPAEPTDHVLQTPLEIKKEIDKENPQNETTNTTSSVEPENQVPEENKPGTTVGDMIGKPGIYKGMEGHFEQEGQGAIFIESDNNRIHELGNLNEIKNNPIEDHNIVKQESNVGVHENGNFTVHGKEYINPFESREDQSPLNAITYDKDGNVVNVRMKTPEGKRVTFRGDNAEDLAYQIHLKEISKSNEERSNFEQFINTDPTAKAKIADAGLPKTAEANPTVGNENVSGQKTEPITNKTQDNAIPKRSTEAVHVDETSGNSPEVGSRVSGSGSEEPTNAQGKQVESKNSGETKVAAEERANKIKEAQKIERIKDIGTRAAKVEDKSLIDEHTRIISNAKKLENITECLLK